MCAETENYRQSEKFTQMVCVDNDLCGLYNGIEKICAKMANASKGEDGMKKKSRIFRIMISCCIVASVLWSAAAALGNEKVDSVWGKYLPAGGQIDDTAIEEIRQWLSVEQNSEVRSGFVAASLIVENARSLVGKYPYVYGGESPEEGGFDCTGLVWYVYNRMSGVDITLAQAGRSKSALAAAGEMIMDTDDFLPGDVVQFTYAHVAIYVGDGRVVHARTTGTLVQETELDTSKVAYAIRYPGVSQNVVVASGECGENVSWVVREDGILTISGKGAMDDYSCKFGSKGELISTAPWADIGLAIRGVLIEEGVTAIGKYAFYNSQALLAVQIAESVNSIGAWAFSGCTALEGVWIPGKVSALEDGVFYGCTALRQISLHDGVTRIGGAAFYGCENLQELPLPASLRTIGECAFLRCTKLRSIEIPEGVTEIALWTFNACTSLEMVAIPRSVTKIGEWAFYGCEALVSVNYGGSQGRWESIEVGENNEALKNAEISFALAFDAPVVTISNNASTGKIVLTWDAIEGAQQYEVWRSKNKNGVYSRIWSGKGTKLTNSSAVAGETFYYQVRAVAGDAVGDFSDAKMRTCDLARTDLTVSTDEISGKLDLSWGAIEGATHYEVYRAVSGSGEYAKITTTADAMFTDTSAAAGVSYDYKVRAIIEGKSAATGAYSKIAGGRCICAQVEVKASNVTTSGKVKLTWDAVDGATHYEVWRSESKNGTYKKLSTTSKTSFINTSAQTGKTYYYKVRAIVDGEDLAAGLYSAIVSRACDCAQVTVTASNVTFSGKIKLTWGAVDGATHYEIWRSTKKDGTYEMIATTSETSLTNTVVEVGKTYYYKVRALVDGKSSATGAYSAIVSRTCDCAQVEVKASNVASGGKVKLTWGAVEGATHYEVWRSESKNGTFEKLTATNLTSVTDTWADAGVTYYYKVRALVEGKSAAAGAYSKVVARTCDLARPNVTVKLSSKGKPALTWDAVVGATQYEVWRATEKDGTYTKLWTGTATKFTNTGAKNGVTYYYKVRALCENSAATSAFSTVQSIRAGK